MIKLEEILKQKLENRSRKQVCYERFNYKFFMKFNSLYSFTSEESKTKIFPLKNLHSIILRSEE